MDRKEVTPAFIKAAEHSEQRHQVIESFRGIRGACEDLEVLVEWEGLPNRGDWTWEPLSQLFGDLPARLEDFLHRSVSRLLK